MRKKRKRKNNLKRRDFRKGALFNWRAILYVFFITCLVYIFVFIPFSIFKMGRPSNFENNGELFMEPFKSRNISSILLVKLNDKNNAEYITLFLFNDEISKLFIFNIPSDFYFYDYSNSFQVKYLSVSQLIYGGNKEFGDGYLYLMWDLVQSIGIPVDTVVLFTPDGYYQSSNIDKKKISWDNVQVAYDGDFVDSDLDNVISLVDNFSLEYIFLHPKRVGYVTSKLHTNQSEIILIKKLRKLNAYLKNTEGITVVDLHNDWGKMKVYNDLGDEVFVINSKNLDSFIQNNIESLADIDILKERIPVEVYNGSGVSLLALRYARKMANSGIPVLRYDNAPDLFDRTTLFIPDPKQKSSHTLEQIKRNLNLKDEDIDIEYKRPSWITTADIIVVLGKNVNENRENK